MLNITYYMTDTMTRLSNQTQVKVPTNRMNEMNFVAEA